MRLLQKDNKNDGKEVIRCRKYADIVNTPDVTGFADISAKR